LCLELGVVREREVSRGEGRTEHGWWIGLVAD